MDKKEIIRPSWNEIHMRQAELIAERSTCAKLNVGAVLVKDNRTISQGYNGVGPGCKHCIDHWASLFSTTSDALVSNFNEFVTTEFFLTQHKKWSTENELHAEQNCILWAAREGISTKHTSLYTIYSPCINCAKVIHTAGVVNVYYKNIYESDTTGITYLQNNNIICTKI
jgi:dCMP deaminase